MQKRTKTKTEIPHLKILYDHVISSLQYWKPGKRRKFRSCGEHSRQQFSLHWHNKWSKDKDMAGIKHQAFQFLA